MPRLTCRNCDSLGGLSHPVTVCFYGKNEIKLLVIGQLVRIIKRMQPSTDLKTTRAFVEKLPPDLKVYQ